MSSHRSRIAEIIYTVNFILLLICSGLILMYLFIPYPKIKSVLDSFPRDGRLEIYTPQFDQKVKFYLRIVFLALLLCGFIYWKTRNRIIRTLNQEWKSLSTYASVQLAAVRKFMLEERRPHKTMLLIVIILGFVIRIIYIFNQPIHHDESKTVFSFASQSFAEVFTNYYVPNNHIFNSFLVKLSVSLFGNHVWSIRLPVFLAGVLALPMAYATCRVLLGPNVALMSTALCATSYPLIQYSSNARGYMLITLFSLCLLFLAEQIKVAENRIAEQLFALCAGLGAWTIPVMLYPFSIAVLWLLASRTSRRRSELFKSVVRISILTGCFVFLVYGLLLLRMGPHALISNEYVSPKPLNYVMVDFWETLKLMNEFVHITLPKPVQFFLFSVLLVGVVWSYRSKPKAFQLAFISFVSCIAFILLQRRVAFARVWLFLVPIYFFLLANGLVMIIEKVFKRDNVVQFTAAFVTIVLIGLFLPGAIWGFSKPTYFGDACIPAPRVLEYLLPQLTQNSLVETASPCAGPIRYYLLSSNVSLDHFYWYSEKTPNAASTQKYDQIFVVVQEPDHDLEFFKYGSKIKNYTAPVLIKEFLPVRIYRVQRLSFPNNALKHKRYSSHRMETLENSKDVTLLYSFRDA